MSQSRGANALINPVKASFVLLLAVALSVPAASAVAAPQSKAAKMAQARAIKGQVDRLDNQLSIADERYNLASLRHGTLLSQARAAQRRMRKANARIGVLQLHLGTRASDMYRTGPLGFIDVLLGTKSFDELASMWDVLKNLNRDDAIAVSQMKVAKAEAAAAHAELSVKEQASARQVAVMRDQTRTYRSMLAARSAKLKGLETEIRNIEAAQQAAAMAAARRGIYGGNPGANYPAPTIPAHGSVVAYARSRLGCPYVYAASGPGAFDCSGLTMWCYRQIGISLPHSSSAQFGSGQHVSRADLQPGDLVFFGSPIHHVGMYIGGGMMIEAPHTGASVRVAPAFRSDYVGACRP
jgi:peptidoglycan DL-endopeptidase CwlO